MPVPTWQDIDKSLRLGGVTWSLTDPDKADRVADLYGRILPQYAAMAAKNAPDYFEIVKCHTCHMIALPLIGSGQNGQAGVSSASAGEVSVSYGSPGGAIKVDSTWDLTEWGQECKRLRIVNKNSMSVGNGPPIRFRGQ
jgi:hypothetical protein